MATFQTKQSYLNHVERVLDFATPPGKRIAVVYSHDYVKNHARAQQATSHSPSLYTIEDTVGGQWLGTEDLYADQSPLSEHEADEIWNAASDRFVAQATVADMETYVIGAQPGGIYRSVEQDAIAQSETVQRINGIEKDDIFGSASSTVAYHRTCETQLFGDENARPNLQDDYLQSKFVEDYEVWLRDFALDIEQANQRMGVLRLRRGYDPEAMPEFLEIENESHQLRDIAIRHPKVLDYLTDEKIKERISSALRTRQGRHAKRPTVGGIRSL